MSEPVEHITWTWPHPTPRGGMVDLICLCGFESVPMSARYAIAFQWFHESGIQGLPGTRVEAARG